MKKLEDELNNQVGFIKKKLNHKENKYKNKLKNWNNKDNSSQKVKEKECLENKNLISSSSFPLNKINNKCSKMNRIKK